MKKLSKHNTGKENKSEHDELTIARKELALQIEAKEKLAAELMVAHKKLAFQKQRKGEACRGVRYSE